MGFLDRTAETTQLSLQNLTIESYLSQQPTFASSYAKALGAAAGIDGVTSLTELSILMDIAGRTASPAVLGVVMLNAIIDRVPLANALDELRVAARDVDAKQREAAFQGALPVLALQGPPARKAAGKFARALQVKHEMFELPDVKALDLFDDIVSDMRRMLGRGDLADTILVCGQSVGHWGVLKHYQAFRRGELSKTDFVEQAKAIQREVLSELEEGEKSLSPTKDMQFLLDDAANKLREQLQQRFMLLKARIRHEQDTFSREIEDLVHDAGNAFERAVQDRLMTDDWRKAQVWESIARMDFAREAEHRIERVLRQRENALRLLHEELRLFKAQVEISRMVAFDRSHHTHYEGLAPPLQLTTQMLDRLDELAKVTLGGGVVATAGAGTAAYFLGVATVYTALAPALPYIGGAVLAAGLVKWLMPPSARRKYAEIRDKRKAFERVVRDKLREAQEAHDKELQKVLEEFCAVAPLLLAPLALEAEAVRNLPRMRKSLVKGAVSRSREALKQLSHELQTTGV